MKILHVVFIVGAVVLAFGVTGPYPVLGAGPILLGVGILLIVGAGSVIAVPEDSRGVGRAGYMVTVFIPWLLAGVLVANGVLDHSPEVDYQPVLVKEDFAQPWVLLTVQSWRTGHTTETLYVKTGFSLRTGRLYPSTFYFPGEPVTVGVRSGALGMPWICRISQRDNSITYPSGPSE